MMTARRAFELTLYINIYDISPSLEDDKKKSTWYLFLISRYDIANCKLPMRVWDLSLVECVCKDKKHMAKWGGGAPSFHHFGVILKERNGWNSIILHSMFLLNMNWTKDFLYWLERSHSFTSTLSKIQVERMRMIVR